MTTSNMTPVVATGTDPPTVALSGLPAPIVRTLRIEIVVGGARGTATFRWRPNADADWEATAATGASVALGSSGLTAAFAASTYDADNAYEATARSRFAWGGVEFPLTSVIANPLLRDADPAVYWLRAFLAAIIEAHLGDRLRAQAEDAGVKLPGAVAHLSNVDPRGAPWRNPRNRYPLLSMFRMRARFDAKTSVWDQEMASVGVAYLLPPMNLDQEEKLRPALAAVSKIVQRGVRQRHDSSFQNGAPIGGAGFAGISSARLVDASEGVLVTEGTELVMPTWIATLEIAEIARPASPGAYEPFEGADVHEDLRDAPTDTVIEDVVEFATDVPPGTFP